MNRRKFVASGIAHGVGAAVGIANTLHGQPLSIRVEKDQAPISIDVGRQLFVDDFVISEMTLRRTMHAARLHEESPLLVPHTALEMNEGVCPVACPFDDGVFYDPQERVFKMWYHAGWFDGVAYATSEDGLHWKRPSLDVQSGTNRVLPYRDGWKRDGATVWLDHEATDASQRFKMFVYFRTRENGGEGGRVYTSPDGIHWVERSRTSPCGDNTSFYYDPFRKKWVYSIRSYNRYGRVRSYREHTDFVQGAMWEKADVLDWLRTDALDVPDPELGYLSERTSTWTNLISTPSPLLSGLVNYSK